MIGWNEDMIMNYTPEIEGQKVAAKYLDKIGFPDDKICHWPLQGRNYAHYAMARPSIQDRIIRTYSFDPGYSQVYASPAFSGLWTR